MTRSHPLGSEASMAELDRLWGDERLTALGVAEGWSRFHGFKISRNMLRDFATRHRARYPDRRRLNGGPNPWPRRVDAACDLYGAYDLVVNEGKAVEDAAAIARVPVAALRRFIN